MHGWEWEQSNQPVCCYALLHQNKMVAGERKFLPMTQKASAILVILEVVLEMQATKTTPFMQVVYGLA